jgi:hypothetical protein
MKVSIAGSRSIQHLDRAHAMAVLEEAIEDAKELGITITEVVSGGAAGVDRLGEEWARKHKISVKRFPADWKKHGKAAGPIRNKAMAEYADALIAIWDGQSKGTWNMMEEAAARGLLVSMDVYVELAFPEELPA